MNHGDLPGFQRSRAKLQPGMFGRRATTKLTPFIPAPAATSIFIGVGNGQGARKRASTSGDGHPQLAGVPAVPSHYDGIPQGLSARVAPVGILSDRARADYVRRVRMLDLSDSAARTALKAQARGATPMEVLKPLERWRRDLGPAAGSGGRANVTNQGVDGLARRLGRIGRGAGLIGTLIAIDDVLSSPNHRRALVANIGAGLGGFLGGAGGAAAGAATGPAAFVAAPAGGFAGSMAGGRLGYEAGEGLYDYFASW